MESVESSPFYTSEHLLDSAIELNLKMSVEERIEAHENSRQLLVDLKQAGDALRAESQKPS